MKKLLLVFILLLNPLIALAEINECKIDVYFANGILTKEGQAESNAKLLRTSIIEKFGIDYYNAINYTPVSESPLFTTFETRDF